MASYTRNIPVTIEDVDGSFKRLVTEAPKLARVYLSDAVAKTTTAIAQRMRALVDVGDDAPHLKDAITTKLPKSTGLRGAAGIMPPEAHEPSSDTALDEGSDQAHIALYNEYAPNEQPFMRPAALDEESAFRARATEALQQVEKDLSSGGGLL